MYAERHEVSITVDASGDGTGYTPVVSGRVWTIRYVKTDYANGVTFVITSETSGVTIWSEAAVNASATRLPRTATHDTAGAGLTYDATRIVAEPIVLANERVKIVVSLGGVSKSGTFYVTTA